MRKPLWIGFGVSILCGVGVWSAKNRWLGPIPVSAIPYDKPSALTSWPLQGSRTEVLQSGVTHSLAISPDGTGVDFFDFDFGKNPRLRWEIFDQDEDDAKPFDNKVFY